MAEENKDGTVVVKDEASKTGKDSQDPQPIPYARFKEKVDEVNGMKGTLAELQKTIADMQAAVKQGEDAKLVEQGKFKDLADQQKKEIESLKGQAGKLTAYSEKLKGLNQKRREKIPENFRDLVPTFDDPMAEFDYLIKFEQKLPDLTKQPGAPPSGPKAGGAGGSPDEISQLQDQLKALDGKNDIISSSARIALTNKIHQLNQQKR